MVQSGRLRGAGVLEKRGHSGQPLHQEKEVVLRGSGVGNLSVKEADYFGLTRGKDKGDYSREGVGENFSVGLSNHILILAGT